MSSQVFLTLVVVTVGAVAVLCVGALADAAFDRNASLVAAACLGVPVGLGVGAALVAIWDER